MAAAALVAPAHAQVGFSASTLGGLVAGSNNKASKVTSLQFGPDNRLYFTQVNGTIIACDGDRGVVQLPHREDGSEGERSDHPRGDREEAVVS